MPRTIPPHQKARLRRRVMMLPGTRCLDSMGQTSLLRTTRNTSLAMGGQSHRAGWIMALHRTTMIYYRASLSHHPSMINQSFLRWNRACGVPPHPCCLWRVSQFLRLAFRPKWAPWPVRFRGPTYSLGAIMGITSWLMSQSIHFR